jgi:AmmeMemoRadiSam system protein B
LSKPAVGDADYVKIISIGFAHLDIQRDDAMKSAQDVRPSAIAGQWYPADERRLGALVDRYLKNARLPYWEGEVVAVMAPHAGHRYSGPVAGYAFAALMGTKPELIAVLSPMHYPHPEPVLSTAHSAYATPLGLVPVEQEALDLLDAKLKARLGMRVQRLYNDMEHSLEIQLPFLQRAINTPFQLLPIMVREKDPDRVSCLGQAIAEVISDRPAILVASTDLSHFYTQRVAEMLDKEILKRVEALDPEGILRAEQEGMGFACGSGALAAALWAAQWLGGCCAQILHYATSGDVTGDYGQVVGYGAALVTRPKKDGPTT